MTRSTADFAHNRSCNHLNFENMITFIQMQDEYFPQFFTATIHEWIHLLDENTVKDIIINSFRFLVKEKKVTIYSFVIMSNHLHIIWRINNPNKLSDVQRDFLRFTAQKIKFFFIDDKREKVLDTLEVNHVDRKYRIWQPDSLSVDLWTREVFLQKADYIHNNPVKAGLCNLPEEYKYSSASFYVLNTNEWDFLTHYEE